MTKIEILIDPTKERIDLDLEKADVLTVIHSGKEEEVKDLLVNMNKAEIEPVYCHYYTKDGTYTIGLKVIDKCPK